MDDFESRLLPVRTVVENYVRFRLCDSQDWEDVAQDVFTLAYLKYSQLKEPDAFKGWILAIARNRCAEYYRSRGKRQEVPLEDVPESALVYGRFRMEMPSVVEDTLEKLRQEERELLRYVYWEELPQNRIAQRLGIPVGTVKSRLHKAKERFRQSYPYPPGGETMKKLPKKMPKYIIEKLEAEPFSVRWEELMGWFIVPKVGEKLCWGIYDAPEGYCTDFYEMEVTEKAKVHGVSGVEIVARERSSSGKGDAIKRVFVVQLTDTHCRYLAALRTEGDVRNYITFLDDDVFMPTWGFGEDNCGHPVHLVPKGEIVRQESSVTTADKRFLLDVVGRYRVTINSKTYDTVCLMDMETKDCNVFSEQYIDQNGKTILWRRFNRDDWAAGQFGGKRWSEKLPENERITVNGEIYVHWYDCITDYVF